MCDVNAIIDKEPKNTWSAFKVIELMEASTCTFSITFIKTILTFNI